MHFRTRSNDILRLASIKFGENTHPDSTFCEAAIYELSDSLSQSAWPYSSMCVYTLEDHSNAWLTYQRFR